jgi:hypothetical protein
MSLKNRILPVGEHLKNNWGKYLTGAGTAGLIGSEIYDPVLTSNISGLTKNLYNIGQADDLPQEDRERFKDYSWKQFVNNIKHWNSADFDKPAAQYNVYPNGNTSVDISKNKGPFKFITHDKNLTIPSQEVNNSSKNIPEATPSPNVWTDEDQLKLDKEMRAHEERMRSFDDFDKIKNELEKPASLPVVAPPKEDVMTRKIIPTAPPKTAGEMADNMEDTLIATSGEPSKPLPNFKSNIILPKTDLANGQFSMRAQLKPSITKLKSFGKSMEDLQHANDPEYTRLGNGGYTKLPDILKSNEDNQRTIQRISKFNKF